MARIRTIKPEFFTSDDVIALSPRARLLYIGLWCEADREGRMEWKPQTFRRRYLPDDDCDINALCDELLARGVVQLYDGGTLAWIPRFRAHQHINPRESASRLPDPLTEPAAPRRQLHSSAPETDECEPFSLMQGESDASARVSDAQGGREGKGKEYQPNGWVNRVTSCNGAARSAGAAFGAGAPPPAVVPMVPPCPVDQVVALYHELLPDLPAVRVMSDKRRRGVQVRWRWVLQSRRAGGDRRATNAPEALDWLRRFFERARDNDFVMGRSRPGRGHDAWRADLDYLLSDRGLLQVLERTPDAVAVAG